MIRRFAVLLALLALPCVAQAQDFIRYWQSGGVISAPLLLPDGTAAAPSAGWASDADGTGTGWYRNSANVMSLSINGTRRIEFYNPANMYMLANDATITLGAGTDLSITRSAAATLQQGAADAAAPVNQTLQSQGVAAGTSDVGGSSYTIRPGLGRGTGVSGPLVLGRNLVTTTGATAQAQQQAFVICGTKTLSNTSATAQTIATITTTTTTAGGVQMFYTVTASDGTNVDADSGEVSVSWNNLAATVAATMSAAGIGSNSVVAPDTLAAVPTVTVATNVVSIKLTPTWVNTVPTLVTGYFTFLNNSGNAIVCQ
jgi:hypothetical protein